MPAAASESRSIYPPLHAHSEYSFVDGTISVAQYVELGRQRGYTHLGLTDHSNLHAGVEFYLGCKKAGIVPILGVEIHTPALAGRPPGGCSSPERYHLVLLARNRAGYHELLRMVSAGYLGENLRDGVPVVDLDALHAEGGNLYVLTSCLLGELASLAQQWMAASPAGEGLCPPTHPAVAETAGAVDTFFSQLRQRFGPDAVYVELIDNGLPEQKPLCAALFQIAAWYHVPVVASCDAHYLRPEDRESHQVATAIRNKYTLADFKDQLLEPQFHVYDDAEMSRRYGQYGKALENIGVLTSQIEDCAIAMGSHILPKIALPSGETPQHALERLTFLGFERRLPALRQFYGERLDAVLAIYHERLRHELAVINSMGFPDYFLIVEDFIGWAKRQRIPVGPGRGSGAGSLVAYSLQITDLDPIPYNLIFERFLNPERVSMPDFDIDFCQWRREEVIHYCITKYGKRNVAQITTFGKMQAKAAVKSVGRALGLSYSEVDAFTKMFPPDLGLTLEDALAAEPRLGEAMAQNEALARCMELARRLEGLVSHTSVHAAGLVITDQPLECYVPVYTTDGTNLITQYEMKPAEKVGLVKFDFLGLKTLTVIDLAVRHICASDPAHVSFDVASLPLDDSLTFAKLAEGSTVGVFQCESAGMTELIRSLRPSSFEDVIALVALFRPGPLGSGMVESFVRRKHGLEPIEVLHPDLEPILRDTYGMILYQEQVQKIAAVLANYTLGEADLLRRAMGKKIAAEMAQQKQRFLAGAHTNNVNPECANAIFDLMAEFAKYGFNKSHSAAYGLVSYQTAYLKAHFPAAFMAASMSCDQDNSDKMVRYLHECRRLALTVHRPDINRSQWLLSVESPTTIRLGFGAIKGIGEIVAKTIAAARDAGGDFVTLADFVTRCDLQKIGRKGLELLVRAGAFDSFAYPRRLLLEHCEACVLYHLEQEKAKQEGMHNLFGSSAATDSTRASACFESSVLGASLPQAGQVWGYRDLEEEKNLLGSYLSAHPMRYFRADITAFAAGVSLEKLLHLGQQAQLAAQRGESSQRLGRRGGRSVEAVCFLAGVQLRRTKVSGKMMAYLELEGESAHYEAIVFPADLTKMQLPSPGQPVWIRGPVVGRPDKESFQFSVEQLLPVEQLRQEQIHAIRWCVCLDQVGGENAAVLAKGWVETLRSYRGQTRAALRLITPGGLYLDFTSQHLPSFEPSNQAMSELSDLLPGETDCRYYAQPQAHTAAADPD